MITVNGTKSQEAGTEPTGVYARKEEKPASRTPFIFGVLISAVVLYVQTAFRGSAADLAEAERSPGGSRPRKQALADESEQFAAGGLDNSESAGQAATS